MQEDPRFTVNRGIVILLPKQPVLDWIMRVDPNPPDITLVEPRSEPDSFLISQRGIETEQDAVRWVHRRWKMFFELFLFDWYTEESWWPQQRSLKMFKEWFDIQYSSLVWDLANEPLAHDDWD
jgi:hypothetical protein